MVRISTARSQSKPADRRAAYGEKWVKKDESDNFAQKHDQETVKNEKRREVEAEVRFLESHQRVA